jgi:hypothetical protein
MNPTQLAHEPCLFYDQASRLYDTIIEMATTSRSLINDRLWKHAERLLEHVACATTKEAGPWQRRIAQYARLALTKLAVTVDAARRASLISKQQAARAHSLMVVLEQKLIQMATDKAPQAPPVQDREQAEVSSKGEDLPADVMANLRELVERDSGHGATARDEDPVAAPPQPGEPGASPDS